MPQENSKETTSDSITSSAVQTDDSSNSSIPKPTKPRRSAPRKSTPPSSTQTTPPTSSAPPTPSSPSTTLSTPSSTTPPTQKTKTRTTPNGSTSLDLSSTEKTEKPKRVKKKEGETKARTKAKTVVVPLSLLDISEEGQEPTAKITPLPKPIPPTVVVSLSDASPSASVSSTPSSTPPLTSQSKKIPTYAISLVLDDSESDTLSTPPPSTSPLSTTPPTSKSNGTNKENATSSEGEKEVQEEGEKEEWETTWGDQLSTLKSAPNPTTAKIATGKNAPAMRGRGRKKFEDDSAEIGTGHPEISSGDATTNSRENSNPSSNGENASVSSGGITAADRADTQKQFTHVLEIHSFPLATTTENLNDYLTDYASMFRLKWVNDTSAIVIFKTPKFATDALARFGNGKYKLRTLSEASDETLGVARRALARKVEETKVTPRPYQTTTTVARRLIANALNMSFKPAQEPDNVDQLREAKRRVWEDDDA